MTQWSETIRAEFTVLQGLVLFSGPDKPQRSANSDANNLDAELRAMI